MNFEPNQQSNFALNDRFLDSKYYSTEQFTAKFKHTSKTFSLLHVNSRSLKKNFESLETMLYTLDNFPFSIIGIAETWLHSISPDVYYLKKLWYSQTGPKRIKRLGCCFINSWPLAIQSPQWHLIWRKWNIIYWNIKRKRKKFHCRFIL